MDKGIPSIKTSKALANKKARGKEMMP